MWLQAWINAEDFGNQTSMKALQLTRVYTADNLIPEDICIGRERKFIKKKREDLGSNVKAPEKVELESSQPLMLNPKAEIFF